MQAIAAILSFIEPMPLPDGHDEDDFRDSTDTRERPVGPGVYLFRLSTPTTIHTTKVYCSNSPHPVAFSQLHCSLQEAAAEGKLRIVFG